MKVPEAPRPVSGNAAPGRSKALRVSDSIRPRSNADSRDAAPFGRPRRPEYLEGAQVAGKWGVYLGLLASTARSSTVVSHQR